MADSSSISDVLIIGAGIAGLVAARRLTGAGLRVRLVDKGRGVGGRLATRRMGGAQLDHGAQFLTARSARFNELLAEWLGCGWVTPWYDRGADKGGWVYRGVPTMNTLAKNLAAGLDVTSSFTVERATRKMEAWRIHADDGRILSSRVLLITCPPPQAMAILGQEAMRLPTDFVEHVKAVKYRRTLTLLATLTDDSAIPEPGILEPTGHPVVRAIFDNYRKGSSALPAITVNSTPEFAERFYDRPNAERGPLLIAAAQPLIASELSAVAIHRWGFSEPSTRSQLPFVSQNDVLLWLASDGFAGPSAERAALSGLAAADDLMERVV